MPIYVLRFEGYVKLGFAHNVGQRVADGFWSNSHPRALCNKLSKDDCTLIAQFEGTEQEEIELQTQFNQGVLLRNDGANEFYDSLELP